MEHLVLGSDGNGNEAMVVTLRMPVSHEDVHDSLPSTSVRLVVFGNNSSMQGPPEGRERDINDGWAAQQETGFRTCTQFLRNTFLLRNTLSD